jgi:hypothetical protein
MNCTLKCPPVLQTLTRLNVGEVCLVWHCAEDTLQAVDVFAQHISNHALFTAQPFAVQVWFHWSGGLPSPHAAQLLLCKDLFLLTATSSPSRARLAELNGIVTVVSAIKRILQTSVCV